MILFWKMNVLKVELLPKGIFVTCISKVVGEGVTDLWRNIQGGSRQICDMEVILLENSVT